MTEAEYSYMQCIQYPLAKRYYIFLNEHAFKEIIRDRIGNIYDCYISHASLWIKHLSS